MSTWTLLAGADVVGEIRDATPDQPWVIGAWRRRGERGRSC